MIVYHMSETLKEGNSLTPDYEKLMALTVPFIQGLERGEECFAGMLLFGKFMYEVMTRSKLRYWANYAKYATEAVFEYVRRKEFPDAYGRLDSNYFYDTLEYSKKLFEYDYGSCPEDGEDVQLFEIELEDENPQYRDMNLYDIAYEAIQKREDLPAAMEAARRYVAGKCTENPTWEIMSDKPAKAVRIIENWK